MRWENAFQRVNVLLKNISRSENDSSIRMPTLKEQIEDARQQWADAVAYFENVTDPALVDYAIDKIQLAEKRFNLLLRIAKEN